jgi:hypothetical protein
MTSPLKLTLLTLLVLFPLNTLLSFAIAVVDVNINIHRIIIKRFVFKYKPPNKLKVFLPFYLRIARFFA